jgi:hypothetical protein
MKLLIKNLEYPLNSISGNCETVIKKLLSISNKDQL